MNKEQFAARITEIETAMTSGDFWMDKNKAHSFGHEIAGSESREAESGGPGGNTDRGDAIMTIFSGAGGDDAEDFLPQCCIE